VDNRKREMASTRRSMTYRSLKMGSWMVTRGPLRGLAAAGPGTFFAVLVVVVDEPIAMEAVTGEDNEDDEIGNHHGEVERVRVINASEGAVR